MKSVPINGGIIVQAPGQIHKVKIPPNGREVTVYEVNAIAIRYGESDQTSNEVLCGGRGIAFTEQEAWDRAVEAIKKQL